MGGRVGHGWTGPETIPGTSHVRYRPKVLKPGRVAWDESTPRGVDCSHCRSMEHLTMGDLLTEQLADEGEEPQ